jgi:hypothetical protein
MEQFLMTTYFFVAMLPNMILRKSNLLQQSKYILQGPDPNYDAFFCLVKSPKTANIDIVKRKWGYKFGPGGNEEN